jgi:hypothetical protein
LVEIPGQRGPYGEYFPTPEEISKACAELQRGWTTQELKKRENCRQEPWQVPVCRLEASSQDDTDGWSYWI